MSKKVRATQELMDRLERDGAENLSRGECRALERKGYLAKKRFRGVDGSVRHQYSPATTILRGGMR